MDAPSDDLNISKQDFLEWLTYQGCEITPLAENKARVLKFINPKNENTAFLALPIDTRTMKDYTVFAICSRLGIEPPTRTSYMKALQSKISKHNK